MINYLYFLNKIYHMFILLYKSNNSIIFPIIFIYNKIRINNYKVNNELLNQRTVVTPFFKNNGGN